MTTTGVGWLLAAIVAAVGALPLLVACPAPLQDWENHVAGAHVLAALLNGDPFWDRFYRFNTFLVPNAAVDLGLLALGRLGLDPALAANLFLLITYGVFVAGFCALSRALGAFDLAKIPLAVLLFYACALFWGLVNYVLGIGLVLGLLATWLSVPRPWTRLAVAAIGAALLLIVHVVPAAVFAVTLCCFDAAWLLRYGNPWSCGSGPLALAVIFALLRAMPGGTGHDFQATYAGAGSIGGFAAWKAWVLSTILLGGPAWQDGATLAAVACGTAALARAARLRLALGPLLAVAGLLFLMLVAPERLGAGSLLDVRLAWPPLLIAAAGLRLQWRSGAARRAALAALTLVVLARTLVIAAEWRAASRIFADYDARAARLPAGAIMMMAHGRPLATITWSEAFSPPLHSIATQVVPRGLFYPALFANPAQQPIERLPRFDALGQPWDLSDPIHAAQAITALASICASRVYRGVYLTMLYPGPFASGLVAPATLYDGGKFLIVDACRLAVSS